MRENIGFYKKNFFLFKGNVFKTEEKTKEEFINNTLTFIENESKDISNSLFKGTSNY